MHRRVAAQWSNNEHTQFSDLLLARVCVSDFADAHGRRNDLCFYDGAYRRNPTGRSCGPETRLRCAARDVDFLDFAGAFGRTWNVAGANRGFASIGLPSRICAVLSEHATIRP